MASPVAGETRSALVVGPAYDLEFLLPHGLLDEVDRAENAAQAIIRLIRKPYNLVLVDHVAEGELTEDQVAYLRALQAIRPESKTIVLASNTTARKVIEGLRHGVFAYFGRPLDPLAVRDTIAEALSAANWSDGIELVSGEADFISVRLRCRVQTADRLMHFMKQIPSGLTEDDRAELASAFHEMLMNAIEHGGKLNPDEWVRVSRVRTRRTIVYHIVDPGEGFSRTNLPHAAISNPPGESLAHIAVRTDQNMRIGGFGMLIASHFVDEVIYNQQGNEVILIKHIE